MAETPTVLFDEARGRLNPTLNKATSGQIAALASAASRAVEKFINRDVTDSEPADLIEAAVQLASWLFAVGLRGIASSERIPDYGVTYQSYEAWPLPVTMLLSPYVVSRSPSVVAVRPDRFHHTRRAGVDMGAPFTNQREI